MEQQAIQNEQNSLGSVVEYSYSDSFPKNDTIADEPGLASGLPLLPGEYEAFVGRTHEGVVSLTNFRFFLQCNDTFHNIPLGLIEQVDVRDIFYLHINCKDARCIRCTFLTSERCMDWCNRLTCAINFEPGKNSVFAFPYFCYIKDDNPALHQAYTVGITQEQWINDGLSYVDDVCAMSPAAVFTPLYNLRDEVKRMKFNMDKVWRITQSNCQYDLCPTYPKELLVPACVPDKVLHAVATFRSSKRIPVVVWRHQGNGGVIARCSQPEIGIWGFWGRRSNEDETLIEAIIRACSTDRGDDSNSDPASVPMSSSTSTYTVNYDGLAGSGLVPSLVQVENPAKHPPLINGEASEVTDGHDDDEHESEPKLKKLLLIDARSFTAAFANKIKGGGSESAEYYSNSEIKYMNLANIHSIRGSFHSLRSLCNSAADQHWLSSLEKTRWMEYISNLLETALVVVNAVARDARPVLVHCSDGWDRTSQIVSLAEIIMDPYYRTMEGFQILVEREWLDFGHKFADRCGLGVQSLDVNERCPVFLQWLDCVYQLWSQSPLHFEFNEAFLLKLVQHTYSCLFGTFLYNNSKERDTEKLHWRTYSVWAYFKLNQSHFRNYLYEKRDGVLKASCLIKDLKFWRSVYMPASLYSDAASLQSQTTVDLTDSVVVVDEGGKDRNIRLELRNRTDSSNNDGNGSSLNRTRSCNDLSEAEHLTEGRARRSSVPKLDASCLGEDPNYDKDSAFDSLEVMVSSAPCRGLEWRRNMLANYSGVVGKSPGAKSILHSDQETSVDVNRLPLDTGTWAITSNGTTIGETEEDRSVVSEEEEDAVVDLLIDKQSRTTSNRAASDLAICESSTDTLVAGDLNVMGHCTNVVEVHSPRSQCSLPNGDALLPNTSRCCSDLAVDCNSNCQLDSYKERTSNDSQGEEVSDEQADVDFNVLSTSMADVHAAEGAFNSTLPLYEMYYNNLPVGEVTHNRLSKEYLDSALGIVPTQTWISQHSSYVVRCHSCGSAAKSPAAMERLGNCCSVPGSVIPGLASGPITSSSPTPPQHSRTPSSGFPATPNDDRLSDCAVTLRGPSGLAGQLDTDGLTLVRDDLQHSLQRIIGKQEVEIARLKMLLMGMRRMTHSQVCCKCSSAQAMEQEQTDDEQSQADSSSSWVEVDSSEAQPIKWEPNYAVNSCPGCARAFSVLYRRHHCRKCGKIFCSECANNFAEVPGETLFYPVRVCKKCYIVLNLNSSGSSNSNGYVNGHDSKLAGTNSTRPQWCKQAAFNDSKLGKSMVASHQTTAAASN